jgi:hypothetical protein
MLHELPGGRMRAGAACATPVVSACRPARRSRAKSEASLERRVRQASDRRAKAARVILLDLEHVERQRQPVLGAERRSGCLPIVQIAEASQRET